MAAMGVKERGCVETGQDGERGHSDEHKNSLAASKRDDVLRRARTAKLAG